MKKIYSILILLALAVSVYAQDARQRTVQTIVADVLAAMPAQNSADFATQIGDLAKRSAPIAGGLRTERHGNSRERNKNSFHRVNSSQPTTASTSPVATLSVALTNLT